MMVRQNLSSRAQPRQQGLAAVEFTIVLPLLLLLFIATAELGRLLYDYNTLTKAQRNGARFLADHATIGQIDTIINDSAAPEGYAYQAKNLIVYGEINPAGTPVPLLPGLSEADITLVNPSDVEDPEDELIQVDVTYAYTPMLFSSLPTFGLGSGSIDLTFTLSSSITMKALRGG